MQANQQDDDKKQNEHSDKSLSVPSFVDAADDLIAEAASEPADIHPVFGNSAQPQEILDKDVIGVNDDKGPSKGEDTAVNFDPENDPRMHDNPPE